MHLNANICELSLFVTYLEYSFISKTVFFQKKQKEIIGLSILAS